MTDVVYAPWTQDQVDTLNAYQRDRRFHPFTCGSGNRRDAFHTTAVLNYGLHDAGQLHATLSGWICPACDYTQNWAHAFMLTAVQSRDEFERQIREAMEERDDT